MISNLPTAQETKAVIKQALYSTKISRLLAEENIAIEFSSEATTASFAPKDRILTYPNSIVFQDQDIHELFMYHEISHAKHLPENSIELARTAGVPFDIVNVVVDIRDERLIKLRYPGCAATMKRGYDKLLDMNFFGKKQHLPMQNFISRLNVYAKLGPVSGAFIPMSPEEYEFYNRCMLAVTYDEVLALSKELASMQHNILVSDEIILEMLKGETDLLDDNEKLMLELEKLKEQRADEIFTNAFKESILSNVNVLTIGHAYNCAREEVSANDYAKYVQKQILKLYKETSERLSDIREYRKDIKTSVSGMVKVFESKKAASRQKMARISNTGNIDINQVFKYQYNDNIFGRRMTIPDSKNHGYYVFIDLSGSMQSIFQDVFSQIVVMVEFFRSIHVPYKVVGFGAQLHVDNDNLAVTIPGDPWEKVMPGVITSSAQPLLFEVLSSNQTLAEHNLSLHGLTNFIGWTMGGTPTGASITAAEKNIVEFFDKNRIDKKHLLVITDGEPHDTSYGGFFSIGKTNVYQDVDTKRTIISKGSAKYSAINAIGKMYEYRHNIQFSTISITSFLSGAKINPFISTGVSDDDTKKFRQQGFVKKIDPFTQNAIYFAKPIGSDVDVGDVNLTNKITTAQIAKELSKNMKNIKKSRVFLNTLVENLS